MARLARLIFVSTGVAVAVWLLPASVHIVGWTASGPVRVALLAPLWTLWTALAIATTVFGVLGVRHRDQRDTVSDTVTPLSLLWLWAIPYLPWIPDRAPALLAFAGSLRWGVVALALFGCAWVALTSRVSAHPIPLPGRRTIFGLSLAIYVCFGLWSAGAVGPGADEPHYLVITQSLMRDHDLAIENNHIRGDYHEYYGGDLRPDFLRRGLNDVIYSIHAPGLPALLIPAFAIAGYRGAVLMLCLFGALAALAVFDLAALLGDRRAAWMTWAAVCLTVPFVPHSWLIFPEMPGALVTAWAALWLYAPIPTRTRTWIWRGLALGLLPWLHTKFVILLAGMTAALLLRLWRSQKAAAALVAPIAISLGLWFYSFRVLYGVLDPQIPYGDFPKLFVLVANIPRGLLGLLFDQKFGLIVYAPVYLIAPAGCWMMLRRSDTRLFTIALLATAVAFVGSTTRMYMWWGGSSAPARFLVPMLPLVAPMIAVAFQQLRAPAVRAGAALLLTASVAVAAIGVSWPQRLLLFSAPHGLANMMDAGQGGSPLSFLLPTFTEEQTRASIGLLLPWATAVLLALAVVIVLPRRRVAIAGMSAACTALVVFAVSGAVLAGSPQPESQRLATASRGRLELMHALDGASLRGLDYGRRVRLNERQLLALTAVGASRAAGDLGDDLRRLAGPFELPPGRYTARLAFGAVAQGGAVFATIGDGIRLAVSELAHVSEASLPFELLVDAPVWIGVSDRSLANSVQRVEIVADSIVPRHARPAGATRAIEPIAGHADAFMAYMDQETYPEGGVFWTRGTQAGTVLVAPAGASALVLTLHVGPVGGRVRVIVAGQDRSVEIARDQTREIEVPIASTDRLVSVTVEAPGQFRPADHEPGSTDQRWLGCQVRIGLR